jgi:hypothetical protein
MPTRSTLLASSCALLLPVRSDIIRITSGYARSLVHRSYALTRTHTHSHTLNVIPLDIMYTHHFRHGADDLRGALRVMDPDTGDGLHVVTTADGYYGELVPPPWYYDTCIRE